MVIYLSHNGKKFSRGEILEALDYAFAGAGVRRKESGKKKRVGDFRRVLEVAGEFCFGVRRYDILIDYDTIRDVDTEYSRVFDALGMNTVDNLISFVESNTDVSGLKRPINMMWYHPSDDKIEFLEDVAHGLKESLEGAVVGFGYQNEKEKFIVGRV